MFDESLIPVRYRFELPDRNFRSAGLLQHAYSMCKDWHFGKPPYHIEFHLCDKGIVELIQNTSKEQISAFRQNLQMRHHIPPSVPVEFHRKAESSNNINSKPFLVISGNQETKG